MIHNKDFSMDQIKIQHLMKLMNISFESQIKNVCFWMYVSLKNPNRQTRMLTQFIMNYWIIF